jgi:hypothetical protein
MGRKARISGRERIERERRIADILALRMQGASLRTIGESLTPQISPQAVFKCIKRALENMTNEAVEQARQIELLRIDELQTGLYERALAGDIPSVGAVLALMMKRSRLLGLDVQPVRFGANEFDQPRVLEIVGDEQMAHAEQVARAALGLARHLA